MDVWDYTTHWKLKVLRIPVDGNCLFGSLCHQLMGYTVPSITHTNATTRLRTVITEYIWNNRYSSRITNAIITRINDEWPTHKTAPYDTKVSIVLAYLRTIGHWGGEETIVAVMELFNVAIKIYYQFNMTQEYRPQNNSPTRLLQTFHRLSYEITRKCVSE